MTSVTHSGATGGARGGGLAFSVIVRAPGAACLVVALTAACGGESEGGPGTGGAAASAGAGGAGAGSSAGGTGALAGASGFGGAGGSQEEFAACERNTECVVVPESCCGSCGVATRDDAAAVHRDRVSDHVTRVCGREPAGCPACARPRDPTLVATCDAGRCRVIDLSATELTRCTGDAECRLRTSECCECGGATDAEHLIALNATGSEGFVELVCDADSACGRCLPSYPSLPVVCTDGRCAVAGGLGGP